MSDKPSRIEGSKWCSDFQMFSEERIALSREVKDHPDLLVLLAKYTTDDFEIMLAEIAAYCDLTLEGDYYDKDIDNICKYCTSALVQIRTGIVFAAPVDDNSEEIKH